MARGPYRQLPARPSQEYLRKEAKRAAKSGAIRLATAQRQLAVEYGYPTWVALMRAVEGLSQAPSDSGSPLATPAARADEELVRDLLRRGTPAEGGNDDVNTPLWLVCDGDAPASQRIAVAELLLDAGASPRHGNKDNATALHAAARRGPLVLVELLIRRGAFSWQADRRGKTALDYARSGSAPDKEQIVETLDRPVIRDVRFRAAVTAIHEGNIGKLDRLLDTHPELLRMRAIEPDCYPRDYFRDPKLFWFVANNPTLMPNVPENIVAIAQTMIARGVERSDLEYTLELLMSSDKASWHGGAAKVIGLLIDAGAQPTQQAIVVALAHRCLDPIEALLDRGLVLTAPIAAALGRTSTLAPLLRSSSSDDRQVALGLAVINGRLECARLCLEAGADPNHWLPVHRHSTPLHQAAFNDDVPLIELLVTRGARLDTRDTLWNGTPLGWAVHGGQRKAEAHLRELQRQLQEAGGGN